MDKLDQYPCFSFPKMLCLQFNIGKAWFVLVPITVTWSKIDSSYMGEIISY